MSESNEQENSAEDFSIISFTSVEEIEKSILDSPFRAIYQTNNFLIPQIQDVIDESKTVNLRPEYQRRSRWTTKQKSLLIESFLLNIPVPPIFLFEEDFARYEVMDGQQRLLSIKEFISNQFKLTSLSILSPLNGLTYATLPSRTKRTLDRASLSAIVLLKESRAALRDASSRRVLELRKFVFERLNTGGKPLNAQEIRNAVYSGPFNDLVISLARDPIFTEIWGIPSYSNEYSESDYESPERKNNSLYKTMGDCQIVLRYFSLKNDEYVKGSMRSILDRCMERNLSMTAQMVEAASLEYRDTLKLAYDVFDKKPFRLSTAVDARPSESMYDAVMVALHHHKNKHEEILKNKYVLLSYYWREIAGDNVERYSGRANTAVDVKSRISAMIKIIEDAINA